MNFRQLAILKGRATRTQFPVVHGAFFVIVLLASWFEPWWSQTTQDDVPMMTAAKLAALFLVLLSLLVFGWLSFATTVRRLHDMNHSAWWYLLATVPIINFVMLALLIFMPPIDINDYGPDPRVDRKARAVLT
jgi:uncharacterized membrane protein YhaH (DUF805 family)